MAQFVYNGVYYYLSGVMERTDFDEMLKKNPFLEYWRFNEKSNTFSNELFGID